MCIVRLAYILTVLTIISLEPVRSQPQPSIIPDKPSSHNSRVSQSVGQRKAKLFVLDEDDDLPRLPSEDISDSDPELAIAIQAPLDAHSWNVPSTEKPLTAPLASVLPRVDDIEDLYESLSRLEKALAIHCSTPHSFVSPLVLYALMIDAGSTASCIHNYGPSAAYKHEVFNQVLPGSSPYADQRRATAEPRRSP